MIDVHYVQCMARYNRWQNENLYGAADTLSDAEKRRWPNQGGSGRTAAGSAAARQTHAAPSTTARPRQRRPRSRASARARARPQAGRVEQRFGPRRELVEASELAGAPRLVLLGQVGRDGAVVAP